MGANNSTCLPCKVAGGNGRRNKSLNGPHDPKVLSSQAQVLKKVSTAAEPHGTSGTASQSATPQDSSANGGSSYSEPLQRGSETVQPQGSIPQQSHSRAPQQPIEGEQLQQVEELQEQPPPQEGEIRPEHEADINTKPKSLVGIAYPQQKELTTVGEKQVRDRSPKPQEHVHVPSHMLAVGAEAVCMQHQGTQQALLSPHSCSVAHRVAAALRAAAGERAAAAAARAAEAAEAAKAVPMQQAGQPKVACRFQTESSAAECTVLGSATECTAECTPERQANSEEEAQRTLQQNSCFPKVSCFSSNDESASEITIRQQAEQSQGKGIGLSLPEQSLISAAKLVGEMFSGAAAAAVAMASSASGQSACDSAEQPVGTDRESYPVVGGGVQQTTKTGNGKGAGDLQEGAVALLGAVDRAMDAITSDEFKKQAVTLLSQSISVAASVVEAVKTCGESAQQQGVFPPPNPADDLARGYPSCAAGYYEALRMSAQQQLSEGAFVQS